MDLPDLHHRLDAVDPAGHLQVDEVDRVVQLLHLLDRVPPGHGGVHRVPVFPEPGREGFAHDFLIVDNHDMPVSLHCQFSLPPARRSRGRSVVIDSSRRMEQLPQSSSPLSSTCRIVFERDIGQAVSGQWVRPKV